jgi:hypothetical protein
MGLVDVMGLFVDGGHRRWPCHSWMVVGTCQHLLMVVVAIASCIEERDGGKDMEGESEAG